MFFNQITSFSDEILLGIEIGFLFAATVDHSKPNILWTSKSARHSIPLKSFFDD